MKTFLRNTTLGTRGDAATISLIFWLLLTFFGGVGVGSVATKNTADTVTAAEDTQTRTETVTQVQPPQGLTHTAPDYAG